LKYIDISVNELFIFLVSWVRVRYVSLPMCALAVLICLCLTLAGA
jgi:hypothetical protein